MELSPLRTGDNWDLHVASAGYWHRFQTTLRVDKERGKIRIMRNRDLPTYECEVTTPKARGLALVDGGATASFVHPDTVESAGLKPEPLDVIPTLRDDSVAHAYSPSRPSGRVRAVQCGSVHKETRLYRIGSGTPTRDGTARPGRPVDSCDGDRPHGMVSCRLYYVLPLALAGV